ncbi:hypothetical protein Tco_0484127 [Tanacetum coccineum]
MMAGLHADNGGADVSDSTVEFAMMGISPKVQNCPLGCDSKINDLNNMYNNLDKLYNDCYIKFQAAYQNAVKTLESQKWIGTKEKNEWEVTFEATLAKFEKWKESSKNLKKLINSSMSTRTKIGLGFKEYFGKDEVFNLSTLGIYPEPVEEDKPLAPGLARLWEMHAVLPSSLELICPPHKTSETYVSCDSSLKTKTKDFPPTVDIKTWPESDVEDPNSTAGSPRTTDGGTAVKTSAGIAVGKVGGRLMVVTLGGIKDHIFLGSSKSNRVDPITDND